MKILLLALLLFHQSVPKYNEFPCEPFTGSPAPPKIVTKATRQFRSRIVEGAKEPPNFAGHYRIVTWGCGGSCIQFVIVDAKTGIVFMPDFYVAHGSALHQERLRDDEPLQFKPDSKLLVVVGSRNEKGEGCYFYKWENGKLSLIKSILEER